MNRWWKTLVGFLVRPPGEIRIDPPKVIHIYSFPNGSFQTAKAVCDYKDK